MLSPQFKIKNKLVEEEKKLLLKINKLTGVNVELWAAASIAKAFDVLKLPYDKTEKTGAPSFTRNFLANHPHELAQSIANAREINKAHTTFIDTITKHSFKGRIHAYVKEADWPNLMGQDGKGEGPKLQMAEGTAQIPDNLLEDVITAAEDCPGECIFIEE